MRPFVVFTGSQYQIFGLTTEISCKKEKKNNNKHTMYNWGSTRRFSEIFKSACRPSVIHCVIFINFFGSLTVYWKMTLLFIMNIIKRINMRLRVQWWVICLYLANKSPFRKKRVSKGKEVHKFHFRLELNLNIYFHYDK